MRRERQKARNYGLRAETLAALALRLKFYKILARNFVAPGGEIDLIVRRGGILAFVEVKARPTLDEARSSIGATKAARISRAARAWLGANPQAVGHSFRGDAMFVAPGTWPRHVEAAFDLDLFA